MGTAKDICVKNSDSTRERLRLPVCLRLVQAAGYFISAGRWKSVAPAQNKKSDYRKFIYLQK